MKILYLDEARQHTLSAGSSHLMRLNPGRNSVDDEVYDEVSQKSKMFKTMVERGAIKVMGEALNTAKMSASRVIELIELETNVAGIDEILKQEQGRDNPRKTVLEAVEERRRVLIAAEGTGVGASGDGGADQS